MSIKTFTLIAAVLASTIAFESRASAQIATYSTSSYYAPSLGVYSSSYYTPGYSGVYYASPYMGGVYPAGYYGTPYYSGAYSYPYATSYYGGYAPYYGRRWGGWGWRRW